ncbi:unnamed protein product [Toxocara canis]|uniref:Secreted protein n=1 Tax=Toxocara canis TaxID=6265 RepID=A0A183VEE4_TOXCA|nr:unnamed protein product [Toxocara canis]
MCTSSIAIATPFLLVIYAFRADAQIAAMFGIATQASNCGEWTPWGPCIWIKGNNPRWQRSYFDQLLPGRTGCREHIFFKLLRDRWGVVSFFLYSVY